MITITLSAADATAHIIENPLVPRALDHRLGMTLALLAALSAVFLRGFREAIGLAVAIVAIYLVLNAVVLASGIVHLWERPALLSNWRMAAWSGEGSPLGVLVLATLLFPKLALGLSGFETGVVVMPLVRGDPDDVEALPLGRIRNTKRLLAAAALIMSVMCRGVVEPNLEEEDPLARVEIVRLARFPELALVFVPRAAVRTIGDDPDVPTRRRIVQESIGPRVRPDPLNA